MSVIEQECPPADSEGFNLAIQSNAVLHSCVSRGRCLDVLMSGFKNPFVLQLRYSHKGACV